MKNWIKSLLVTSGVALAATSYLAVADNQNAAKAKVESVLGLKVSAIGDAPVPGLLQLVTDRGLFYTSEDGKYFLQARVFNLDENMRNETENALTGIRLDGIKNFENSVIEFKAKNERYVVNVFTDITCGYCRKLHNEIADYNKRGITVRYLAFPRGGLASQSYDDMVSVWCSTDKQEALTQAKAGERIEAQSCANEVEQQYAFGQRIGVSGTPNIILPDGTLIGGYQPASVLLESLKAI